MSADTCRPVISGQALTSEDVPRHCETCQQKNILDKSTEIYIYIYIYIVIYGGGFPTNSCTLPSTNLFREPTLLVACSSGPQLYIYFVQLCIRYI